MLIFEQIKHPDKTGKNYLDKKMPSVVGALEARKISRPVGK